ncbi:MAG: uracil-DNA glycosylase, partial [Candidatus Marinimicrobia bacterium]|nr:uracil-DNA glycosylase [Candidatus Neomarinimicrobiota bacterium]
GRVSGAWLLGEDLALKDMRNKSYIYNGIEMMVTYHPAALLRNPNWKRPCWEDMQKVRDRILALTQPQGHA